MSVALRNSKPLFFLLIVFLLAAALNGCQGKATPAHTPVETAVATRSVESSPAPAETLVPTQDTTDTPLFPADTPTAALPTPSPTEPSLGTPSATPTAAATPTLTVPAATPTTEAVPGQGANPPPVDTGIGGAYPGPGDATPVGQASAQDPYPGPGDPTPTLQPTSGDPYPPPQGTPSSTPTPRPGNTPGATAPATAPATVPVTPSATGSPGTPGPTATERISEPLGTPPADTGIVTIWHSWEGERLNMLMLLIDHFQDSFPDVRFDVIYAPPDDLLYRYEALSYLGGGPSVLIGSSDWTPYLVDRQLVEDLSTYTSQAFLQTINTAALDSGRYQDQLACLPVGVSGTLLYRNRLIIPEAAGSLETLLANAEAATKAGTVGAYLERGFAFSFANLYGLGGRLLDANGQPAFQDQDYRYSIAWIDLLNTFLRPGAASFNTEDDTNTFMQSRAGYIIDGSWNLKRFADAIGAGNLVVDPWPTVDGGRLSGYVKAECIYLNVNTAGVSAQDHLASLRFMGYLMVPQVQAYLAEVDLIPSALASRPRLALHQQAIRALAGGTGYPTELLSKDGALRPVYQDALNAALESVFEEGMAPREALEEALEMINQRLDEMQQAEE